MSVFLGDTIFIGGGSGGSGGAAGLNIDYGATPPSDTSKLWVPLASKPDNVEVSSVLQYGDEYVEVVGTFDIDKNLPAAGGFCRVGDYCYILGSNYSSTSNSTTYATYKYNLKTNETIDTGVSFPVISGKYFNSYTAVPYGTDIYCFTGGWDKNKIAKFDTISDTWSTITTEGSTSMGTYPSGAVYDNKIYVVGGFLTSSATSANITCYDPQTNERYLVGTIPEGRYKAGIAIIDDILYIIGGCISSGNAKYAYRDLQRVNLTTLEQYTSIKRVFGYNTSYDSDGDSYIDYLALWPCWTLVHGGNIYLTSALYNYSSSWSSSSDRVNISNTNYNNLDIYKYESFSPLKYNRNLKSPISLANITPVMQTGPVGYFLGSNKEVIKLTIKTPLEKDKLLIHVSYGASEQNLFPIINTKDTQVNVHLIKAYLGGSDGYAQEIPAYTYNGTDWVSLDGVNYAADAINALNILGVSN